MGEKSDTARRSIEQVAREHYDQRKGRQPSSEIREQVRRAVVENERAKK